LRCLEKTFNFMEGEDSMEGGVKFFRFGLGEIGLDAQFTVDSTI